MISSKPASSARDKIHHHQNCVRAPFRCRLTISTCVLFPNHRFFGKNDIIERLRRAVPFDYIFISGLYVDHYRFGNGFSIDTDLPPGYVEAYHADRLYAEDPFVAAAKAAKSVVVEHEVYAEHSPPQRLLYLQRTFGVHNRTLFPIARESVTYGAVGVTRPRRSMTRN